MSASTDNTPVIEVENLVVEYGKGDKRHRAVDGISFRVDRGECIGFIGANGAGKSTTIKSLMGFLFPTSGSVRVFGHPAGDARSRQQIGYLPEVALYYPFMKARELLELYGGLSGMTRTELRAKIPPVLEKVGLGGRAESLLKNFSKGMQQRLGIAQALLHEPHALVLDELSSGLDPLGRHDLRQVLVELKNQGRTIFFSSHELTEVESLCDRVVIIHRGRIVQQSRVTDLLKPLNQFELTFLLNDGGGLPKVLDGVAVERDGDSYKLMLSDVDLYSSVLTELTHRGCTILRTSSRTRNLEEVFIDLVGASAPAGR